MDHMGKLKLLVNDINLWDAFKKYIEDSISVAHKNLEQAVAIEDVYRYQGEVKRLRRFLLLRDEVNGPERN